MYTEFVVNNQIFLMYCDDDKSLMKQLYGTNLVIFRAFYFPLSDIVELNS